MEYPSKSSKMKSYASVLQRPQYSLVTRDFTCARFCSFLSPFSCPAGLIHLSLLDYYPLNVHTQRMTADDFSNPLKKYKLVFLGEQSGRSSLIPPPVAMAMGLFGMEA